MEKPSFLLESQDALLFKSGCHYELYEILGAHLRKVNGVDGVHFAVWAPNARSVSLSNSPMQMGSAGIWTLFVPGLKEGARYQFEIVTKEGNRILKSDPFAFFAERRPETASIVVDTKKYAWSDAQWMAKRSGRLDRPINVYELHLGSWQTGGAEFPNYREVAIALAAYCLEMGFTHVELLPIMEHPLDESWGYQVTGFFAVTSRYGSVEDFQFFVDHLHQQGIGVILDWVPAHFPMDDFSLHRFDGTALFEHEDPQKGLHPHWNTAIFDYSRKEVANFLIASALYWLKRMHIDGLRVDAVASMLYLDYGRQEGEWAPNIEGTNLNLEAIEFIKHLNMVVHQSCPGVLMIAEESSAFPGVTTGALGFDLKWNMGWMNDTLRYLSKEPIHRKFHQNDLTFSLLYAFTEKFVLPLSHDEVVHEKGSLLSKMPGPDSEKFANARLLYSYMMTHPGKKLLFMGGELGQWSEWDCKGEVAWYLLQYPLHAALKECVKDLNFFYRERSAFWRNDFDWEGFEWVDFTDSEKSVMAYLRKGDGKQFLIVHHFGTEYEEKYPISLKNGRWIEEVFNTDGAKYGGSNKLNGRALVNAEGVSIGLPPLATLIFEVHFEA